MAFREQEPHGVCDTCAELTCHTCARCGRPLCVEHMHGESSRCARCEASFDERLAILCPQAEEELTFKAPHEIQLVLGGALLGCSIFFLLGAGLYRLLGMLLFVSMSAAAVRFGPWVRIQLRDRARSRLVEKQRNDFLEERKPHLLSSSPSAQPEC